MLFQQQFDTHKFNDFVYQLDVRITFIYNNGVDAVANHFKQRVVEGDDPVMYQL